MTPKRAAKPDKWTNHNVNSDLHPLLVDIDTLVFDPHNARVRDERAVNTIAKSLLRSGQQKPLVVMPDGKVIAGNGTLKAALTLGWDAIAVTRFHGTELQAKEFAIADNRTSDLSHFDDEILAIHLEELRTETDGFDIEAVGYTEAEVMELLAANIDDTAADGEDQWGKGEGETGLPASTPTGEASHIRMVQLFLSNDVHPQFIIKLKALAPLFGAKSVTDAVLACVIDCHRRMVDQAIVTKA